MRGVWMTVEVNEEFRTCENDRNVLTAVEVGDSVRGSEAPRRHGNATIQRSGMYASRRGLMRLCDEVNSYAAMTRLRKCIPKVER